MGLNQHMLTDPAQRRDDLTDDHSNAIIILDCWRCTKCAAGNPVRQILAKFIKNLLEGNKEK